MKYKAIVKWLLLFLLLGTGPTAMSQGDDYVPTPCQSTWKKYSGIQESLSTIRSDNAYRVSHVQSMNTATGIMEHVFIILNYSSGVETAITTTFNIYDGSDGAYSITDMELFNGECYFCGQLVTPYLDLNGNPLTKGFVGHFSPQAIQVGSGGLLFYVVHDVYGLPRLTVTRHSDGMPLVSLIGKQYNGDQECLMELHPNASAEWYNRFCTLNTPLNVIFSDIQASADSITLLSQMKCDNDHPDEYDDYDYRHQVFLLDRFGLSGCSNSYYPTGHYMAYYLMNDFCNFHYRNAPMALSRMGYDGYGFAVAFGVKEDGVSHTGIRLFPFNNAWSYDSCIYYRLGPYTTIEEMGNLSGTNTLFLLSRDNTHTNRTVTIPTWGASHSTTILYSNNYNLGSLTQRGTGNYIDITGRDGSKTYHLFNQSTFLLSFPSCFDKGTYTYSVLPQKNAVMMYTDWEFSEPTRLYWENADFSDMGKLEEDVVCKKCISD